MRIPLSAPDITESEIASVVEVLRSPRLSLGPKLEEFERDVADYSGAKYAVAVNSGTSGLHLCVRALGLKAGDEVITTGGIAGRVEELGENFVTVEIADGIKVKLQRVAIVAVLPKGTLKSA